MNPEYYNFLLINGKLSTIHNNSIHHILLGPFQKLVHNVVLMNGSLFTIGINYELTQICYETNGIYNFSIFTYFGEKILFAYTNDSCVLYHYLHGQYRIALAHNIYNLQFLKSKCVYNITFCPLVQSTTHPDKYTVGNGVYKIRIDKNCNEIQYCKLPNNTNGVVLRVMNYAYFISYFHTSHYDKAIHYSHPIPISKKDETTYSYSIYSTMANAELIFVPDLHPNILTKKISNIIYKPDISYDNPFATDELYGKYIVRNGVQYVHIIDLETSDYFKVKRC